MNFDLQTIEANLAKAKEEVAFWESAKAVLSDPRIAALYTGTNGSQRGYGELKKNVYAVLPAYGEVGATTTTLVSIMEGNGYKFASKAPGVSVNEALKALEEEGKVKMIGREGLAKLWTRSEKAVQENQEASEEASQTFRFGNHSET